MRIQRESTCSLNIGPSLPQKMHLRPVGVMLLA